MKIIYFDVEMSWGEILGRVKVAVYNFPKKCIYLLYYSFPLSYHIIKKLTMNSEIN